MKTELYIGGQAGNGKVTKAHLNKCIEIIKCFHNSFTYEKIGGLWEYKQIETIKITILHENKMQYLKELTEELKDKLRQDKILITRTETGYLLT